jgi:hypothetical protein
MRTRDTIPLQHSSATLFEPERVLIPNKIEQVQNAQFIEKQVLILKGCTLIEEIWNGHALVSLVKVTKQVVFNAIDSLNRQSENKLGAFANATVFHTADHTKRSKSRFNLRTLYCEICEDSRLSLPAEGFHFRALLIESN